MKGSYLIDDRDANGVLDFEGEHIKFGQEKFKIVMCIELYFDKENIDYQKKLF